MKNRALGGIVDIAIGTLIAIGPHTIFKVCEKGETAMKCWWTVQAEIGIGALLVVLGILSLLFADSKIRAGINIMSVPIGAVAVLLPSVLIGGCAKPMMACQSLTFPAIYILGGASIVFGLANSLYLLKGQRSDSYEYKA